MATSMCKQDRAIFFFFLVAWILNFMPNRRIEIVLFLKKKKKKKEKVSLSLELLIFMEVPPKHT
jgi:hypothetical protein